MTHLISTLLIIMFIVIIFCVVYGLYYNQNKKQTITQKTITNELQNLPSEWTNIKPAESSNIHPQSPGGRGSQVCSVYTFENKLNSDGTITFGTPTYLYNDFVDSEGNIIPTPNDPLSYNCLYQNQLSAQYFQRTCSNPLHKDTSENGNLVCMNTEGKTFKKGDLDFFFGPCQDISYCDGRLGLVSTEYSPNDPILPLTWTYPTSNCLQHTSIVDSDLGYPRVKLVPCDITNKSQYWQFVRQKPDTGGSLEYANDGKAAQFQVPVGTYSSFGKINHCLGYYDSVNKKIGDSNSYPYNNDPLIIVNCQGNQTGDIPNITWQLSPPTNISTKQTINPISQRIIISDSGKYFDNINNWITQLNTVQNFQIGSDNTLSGYPALNVFQNSDKQHQVLSLPLYQSMYIADATQQTGNKILNVPFFRWSTIIEEN